jgi:electron transport complex protein RnfB
MRPTPETAAEIAARVGMDPQEAFDRLYAMGRKILIGVHPTGDTALFELMPWVVGVYEGQLFRLDRELAALFDAYFEAPKLPRSTPASDQPETPMHRIVPVQEAVDVDGRILPYETARHIISQAKSRAVRECICRKFARLRDRGCDYPLETCMVFSDRENAFADSDVDRPIDLEEALRILQWTEELGLVHSIGNFRGRHEYICNCCRCCCGIIGGAARSDHPSAVLRADFLAQVDAEACVGCETCLDRCPMGALSAPEEACVVDEARCIGCGVCASACPSEALTLARRDPTAPPPVEDLTAWMAQRARERGVLLDRDTRLPWAPVLQPPKRD